LRKKKGSWVIFRNKNNLTNKIEDFWNKILNLLVVDWANKPKNPLEDFSSVVGGYLILPVCNFTCTTTSQTNFSKNVKHAPTSVVFLYSNIQNTMHFHFFSPWYVRAEYHGGKNLIIWGGPFMPC
jgi:hypothetical protein